MPRRRMLAASGAVLLLLAATGLGLLLVRPPLRLAAAERLCQALAFRQTLLSGTWDGV